MMRHAFLHYTYIGASCIALFAFFLVFLGAFLWVFRKNAAPVYEYVSALPLQDDSEGEIRHESK